VSSGGFSSLLRQYVVLSSRTSRVPRFEEHRAEVMYPAFIYGLDSSTGEPLLHTCDPDQLGTYFDPDNSRLHYLTPVNFKREVLIPYAQEPNRYRLRRSRLECLSLWGLDMSLNSAGVVEVYLGGLGRDLPSDEWGHWLTYNVMPEGRMEEGRFRRDFLNQFAASPDIPSDLRRARDEAAAATERLFGTPVWRPLGEDITPEYESMIGPLSEDPVALQGPLILLAKCFVDAIDPAALKALLGDAQSGEKSLSLLGRAAERLGGSRDDVEGLRSLYEVRSAGGFAHLRGVGTRRCVDAARNQGHEHHRRVRPRGGVDHRVPPEDHRARGGSILVAMHVRRLRSQGGFSDTWERRLDHSSTDSDDHTELPPITLAFATCP
jgi:hypothetical protein